MSRLSRTAGLASCMCLSRGSRTSKELLSLHLSLSLSLSLSVSACLSGSQDCFVEFWILFGVLFGVCCMVSEFATVVVVRPSCLRGILHVSTVTGMRPAKASELSVGFVNIVSSSRLNSMNIHRDEATGSGPPRIRRYF